MCVCFCFLFFLHTFFMILWSRQYIIRMKYILQLWSIIIFFFKVFLNIYFCFIDYAKAFDCVDHNKLWKILKEMRIPHHLTCLLRNLYAGQEATFRTGHGTTNWFQVGKGVRQGCILLPCLFNSYAEWKWKWSRSVMSDSLQPHGL